jgi:predicted metal-dependent peptidase
MNLYHVSDSFLKKISDIEMSMRHPTKGCPFFLEMLYRVNIMFTDDKKIRACVFLSTKDTTISSRRVSLVFEEEFANSLNEHDLLFILLHELMHIVNLSGLRGKGKINSVFNYASDYVINHEITGIEINDIKLDRNKIEVSILKIEKIQAEGYNGIIVDEPIYYWLLKNNMGKEDNFDTHDYINYDDLDDLTKEYIKDIVRYAEARGYGNMPNNLSTYIKELLRPQVSWKKEIKDVMNEIVYSKTNMYIDNWCKLSRKCEYYPGRKYISTKLIIAVDTSGSTYSTDVLTAFFTEIESVINNVEDAMMIQCDCEIADINKKYKKGDYLKINIKGGGGTAVQPVFDYIKENKLTHYTLIYFTDGYFDYNFSTHGIKTIWCNTTYSKIPFGKNIHIKI